MIQAREIADKPTGEISWTDDTGKKHWAHFAVHSDDWALANSLPHAIVLNNTQQVRYANIKKTVLSIAVDENNLGEAITEKWQIKAKFY